MRTLKYILFFGLLILPMSVSSQSKSSFLTYELEGVKDVATFKGSDPNLYFFNYHGFAPGFFITHQINSYIFLESGFYLHVPAEFEVFSLSSDTTSLFYLLDEFQIPIRVRFQKSFFNERINPFLTIGTTLSFNGKESNYFDLFSLREESRIISWSNDYSKNRVMLELGLGIDFRLSRNFFLGFRYRCNYSLKEQAHLEAISLNDITNETINYKLVVPGHSQSYSLSASYRISSIWNKKVK